MADIWEKQLYQIPEAHARVCKENKEKNDCQLKSFAAKGLTLEACRRTVMLPIAMIFATRILYNITSFQIIEGIDNRGLVNQGATVYGKSATEF